MIFGDSLFEILSFFNLIISNLIGMIVSFFWYNHGAILFMDDPFKIQWRKGTNLFNSVSILIETDTEKQSVENFTVSCFSLKFDIQSSTLFRIFLINSDYKCDSIIAYFLDSGFQWWILIWWGNINSISISHFNQTKRSNGC